MGHEDASSQVVHHCLGSILAFIHGFAAHRCSRDGIGACGKDVASVGSGGGDEDGTGVGDATGDVQSLGGIGESAVGCSFSDGSSYSLSGSVTTVSILKSLLDAQSPTLELLSLRQSNW